jgi:hypothetical protein
MRQGWFVCWGLESSHPGHKSDQRSLSLSLSLSLLLQFMLFFSRLFWRLVISLIKRWWREVRGFAGDGKRWRASRILNAAISKVLSPNVLGLIYIAPTCRIICSGRLHRQQPSPPPTQTKWNPRNIVSGKSTSSCQSDTTVRMAISRLRASNVSASHLGSSWFESREGDRLSCHKFSLIPATVKN